MSTQLKNITYRKGLLSDNAAIIDFQLAMAWETEKMKLDRDTVTLGVAEVFKSPYRGQYFVAECTGKVVGCLLTLSEWSDWRNGEVWWIHSLYVEPTFRGQGVYKGLYTHLKNVATEATKNGTSVRGFRLYVDKTNTSAQAVYKKLGMTDEHYSLFEWLAK
jgi:ribosomal protein S18 acetylase RimI-like enzyme